MKPEYQDIREKNPRKFDPLLVISPRGWNDYPLFLKGYFFQEHYHLGINSTYFLMNIGNFGSVVAGYKSYENFDNWGTRVSVMSREIYVGNVEIKRAFSEDQIIKKIMSTGRKRRWKS